jgi:hypothetical protein
VAPGTVAADSGPALDPGRPLVVTSTRYERGLFAADLAPGGPAGGGSVDGIHDPEAAGAHAGGGRVTRTRSMLKLLIFPNGVG